MVLNWKYVFLVGLQSLLAQETVVEAFEEDSLGLSLVGVVPLSDYQKALADVAEVRSGLEIELRATRAVFEVKEGSWKNQLLTLKGERDEALSKVQELELALAASHQTWMQALQQWHGKVDDAMTSVRVRSAQGAVETTAKLSKEWQLERNQLVLLLKEMSQKLVAAEQAVQGREKEMAQVAALKASLNQKDLVFEELTAQVVQLTQTWQTKGESHKLALRERDERIAELETSQVTVTSERDARINELEKLQLASERALSESQQENQALVGKMEVLQAEYSQLAAQSKEFQREIASSEKKATALGALQKQVQLKSELASKLEDKLGRMVFAQRTLEEALSATMGEYRSLQQSYSGIEAEVEQGKAVSQELAVTQKELAALREELAQKKELLEKAEQKRKSLEKSLEDQLETGKEVLGKREAELARTKRELGKIRILQGSLKQEREALRKRFLSVEPVRYEIASANVQAQQQRVLAKLQQVLEVMPDAQFEIRGHTCDLGDEEKNVALSLKRATALRDYLVEQGMREERFQKVEGLGHAEPQVPNENEESRKLNRRVEIRVVP